MKKLLPLILVILGLGAGAGAGLVLRDPSADAGARDGHAAPADDHATPGKAPDAAHADSPAGAPAAGAGHGDAVEVLSPPADDGHGGAVAGVGAAFDYVKLTNQFIVPIVDEGRVVSMMVLSLGLEVAAGGGDTVYAREPKLRDALLQVLFDHANAGGFRGRFTEAEALVPLRRALREAAQTVLPGAVNDVLIADIVRHDS